MKDDVRDKIVELLKTTAKKKGNANVKLAIKVITGNPLPGYEVEKIIGMIERDKDYKVKPRGDDDFSVIYVGQKLSERNPYVDWLIKAGISAIVTSAIGLLIALPKFQEQDRIQRQQFERLQNLSDSLAMFQKHLMDSSLHK